MNQFEGRHLTWEQKTKARLEFAKQQRKDTKGRADFWRRYVETFEGALILERHRTGFEVPE